MKQPCIYILANKRNGTLYTGVTSDLLVRISQHKDETFGGFSARYNVRMLVYYELFDTMEIAIEREKRVKRWRRAWKLKLIEEMNPEWVDLRDDQRHIILDGPADIDRPSGGLLRAPLDYE